MSYQYHLRTFTEFYNKAIQSIDGYTTGIKRMWKDGNRELSVQVWSPVSKNKLTGLFKNYYESTDKTLVIGFPCEFDYSDEQIVKLDGKQFKGFYRK